MTAVDVGRAKSITLVLAQIVYKDRTTACVRIRLCAISEVLLRDIRIRNRIIVSNLVLGSHSCVFGMG